MANVASSSELGPVCRALSPAFHSVPAELLEVSCAFPSLNHQTKYFEVGQASSGTVAALAVGLGCADLPFVESCLPGWNNKSVGVHSDDGTAFVEGEPTFKFTEPWASLGSVVGMGVLPSGHVFFTKGGQFVGFVTQLASNQTVYPWIGVSDRSRPSVDFHINLNGPYVFDLNTVPSGISSVSFSVAAFGANSHGQLGRDNRNAEQTPQLLTEATLARVKAIACGHDHSLYLCDDGSILGSGSNLDGQLAQERIVDFLRPVPLQKLSKTKLVAAGSTHSAAVSTQDELFVWGRVAPTTVLEPTLVQRADGGRRISKLVAGEQTTFALFDDGTLGQVVVKDGLPSLRRLSVGSNVKDFAAFGSRLVVLAADGRLALIDPPGSLLELAAYDERFDAIAAVEGHFAAVCSSSNEVWSWTEGQLDPESASRLPLLAWRPQSLATAKSEALANMRLKKIALPSGCRALQLALGWKSLIVLTGNGQLLTLGDPRFNGLGSTELFNLRPIPLPESAKPVAVASSALHALVLLQSAPSPWRLEPSARSLPHWDGLSASSEARSLVLQPPSFLSTPASLEYEKALAIFKQCDGARQFQVQKIEIIDNPALESAFEAEIKKMGHKHRSSPSTFKSCGWKEEASPLREAVHRQFEERSRRFDFNSGRALPILPVLHGTSSTAAHGIAGGGFSALAKRDEGFYGRGIYFTTSARSSTKYSTEQNGNHIILLSYCLPGNVYPVKEHPHKPGSLKGTAPRPGYQAHYVRVNAEGLPAKKGVADELVIFQESQALPRYILHVKECETADEVPQVAAPDHLVHATLLRQAIDSKAPPKLSYFERRKLGPLLADSSKICAKDADWLRCICERLGLREEPPTPSQGEKEEDEEEEESEQAEASADPTEAPTSPTQPTPDTPTDANSHERLRQLEEENRAFRRRIELLELRVVALESKS